jgi:hypothetical protein
MFWNLPIHNFMLFYTFFNHLESLPACRLTIHLGLGRISNGCLLRFRLLVDWRGITKAGKERKMIASGFKSESHRGSDRGPDSYPVAATPNGGRMGSKTLLVEKAVTLVSLNKNWAYYSSQPSLTPMSLLPLTPFFSVAWATVALNPQVGRNLGGNSCRAVSSVKRLSAVTHNHTLKVWLPFLTFTIFIFLTVDYLSTLALVLFLTDVCDFIFWLIGIELPRPEKK